MNKSSIKKIIIIAALVLIGGITFYFMRQRHVGVTAAAVKVGEQAYISDYQEARDKKDILEMFVTDRYWLLSSDDYDTEFMLDYKAPSKETAYVGKMRIKVLRENGKFAGFTTYYKTTVTEGHILFVAVHKDFRGKGNAKKLAQFAFDDLVRMGCKRVWLLTRAENYPAQAVYKKLGFEVTEVDPDGYIFFQKFAQ